MERDKETETSSCFDAKISAVIGKCGVCLHLRLFVRIAAKHLLLEIIVTVAPQGNGHIIELSDFLTVCNRCPDLSIVAVAHFRNRLNIVSTVDAIYPVQLRKFNTGIAVELIEVAEQCGIPGVAVSQDIHTITSRGSILVQFNIGLAGSAFVTNAAIRFQILKMLTSHVSSNLRR